MIRIEFSRSSTVFARLVQGATWSRWSHVAIVHPHWNSRILSSVIGAGVGFEKAAPPWQRQRFWVDAPPEVFDYAESQIGKPYDLMGAIGIALHRDWRSDDSWFCSELVAWAFEKAGVPLLRTDNIDRITPGMLALSPLLKPL